MEYTSTNPYNGNIIAKHHGHTDEEIKSALEASQAAYRSWRKVAIPERAKLMRRAGEVLRENAATYAEMITQEMGKPISESKSEVIKCALACDYYAEHTEEFLRDEVIKTDASTSFVKHEPIGTILAVMPWNFPFWQVFRFAAPTLMAGNVGILKHASNVIGCAKLIEEVFSKAGFPSGVFQNLIFNHEQTEDIIAHDVIKAVTLTGSEGAGAAIAALAGKYLKKSLMELGGSNAFIIWKDADLDQVVETAVNARMMNSGQSCIAAKRFIIVEDIYEEFVSKFTE
ncbi:MAG: aldehyde dehydrogenase family protein, partial [Algoriphagus sp.]